MLNILIKAFGFVLVIIIAYLLKHFGILEKRDGITLSKIIMNVTLPCALINNASGIQINSSMIIVLIIGLISNIIMVSIAYLSSKKEDKLHQAYYMINCSGYNIGNFVMPFAQSFFPGLGVTYLCMFDIGNSIMCLGGSYALASSVANAKQKLTLKYLLKKLSSSIPFDTYIIILLLAIFKITIPSSILSITSFIGAGNGFLAMFMIGLLLEINVNKKEMKIVYKTLLIRLLGGAILMMIVFFMIDLPLLAKKIIVLAMAAPLTTASAAFSDNIGYHDDAPAISSSISIIISIIVLVCFIVLFS